MSEEEADKESEDNQSVDEILAALSLKIEGKIKRGFRRGKNSKGPRVVVLEFYDKNTRNEAIRNARNLRSVTKYSSVYTNKDLTWCEIEEVRAARKERKEKNEELEFRDE